MQRHPAVNKVLAMTTFIAWLNLAVLTELSDMPIAKERTPRRMRKSA
jgi:hypothetical protein